MTVLTRSENLAVCRTLILKKIFSTYFPQMFEYRDDTEKAELNFNYKQLEQAFISMG